MDWTRQAKALTLRAFGDLLLSRRRRSVDGGLFHSSLLEAGSYIQQLNPK